MTKTANYNRLFDTPVPLKTLDIGEAFRFHFCQGECDCTFLRADGMDPGKNLMFVKRVNWKGRCTLHTNTASGWVSPDEPVIYLDRDDR